MLDTLSPLRWRRIIAALIALVVVAVVTGYVNLRSPGAPAPSAQGKSVAQEKPGPVLVVPGYGGGVVSLAPLIAELKHEGRDVVVVHPSEGGVGDMRVQAKRLGVAAQQAMKDSGASSVDVIGYSAGGVIALIWVRDDGGGPIARRVLAIGAPYHGTHVEAFAKVSGSACPAACVQLTPGSDMLKALNEGDESPDGPQWFSIRTSGDRVVTPIDSAFQKGAFNLLIQDVCPAEKPRHSQLPSNPVVMAALKSVLGEGPPRTPQNVSC